MRKQKVKQTKKHKEPKFSIKPTPAVLAMIIQDVSRGYPIDTACLIHSVDFQWSIKDEDAKTVLKRAKALCEGHCIDQVENGGDNWQRWKWLLERINPSRWSSTDISLDELDEEKMIDLIDTLMDMSEDRGYDLGKLKRASRVSVAA